MVRCEKARLLWQLLLAIGSVNWVFPKLVCGSLLSWQSSFVGKKHKKAWMAASLCISWTIWHERNMMAFENEEFSFHRMNSNFICNLWSWSNARSVERHSSLLYFLTWLGCK